MGAGLSAGNADKREGRRRCAPAFVGAIQRRVASYPSASLGDGQRSALDVQPGTVRVVMRKRPLFDHERAKGEFDVITCMGSGKVAVHETRLPRGVGYDGELESHEFTFSHAFDSLSTNDEVFQHSVRPLVNFALGGGQGTAFMFGQTGSGKTYTMGAMYERAASSCFPAAGPSSAASVATVTVSFIELVGDQGRDLLRQGEDGLPAPVKLLTDADGCVQLHGQLELAVQSAPALIDAIGAALALRSSAATGVHDHSSRSHAVCR
jgi:kinesin family protein 2/24